MNFFKTKGGSGVRGWDRRRTVFSQNLEKASGRGDRKDDKEKNVKNSITLGGHRCRGDDPATVTHSGRRRYLPVRRPVPKELVRRLLRLRPDSETPCCFRGSTGKRGSLPRPPDMGHVSVGGPGRHRRKTPFPKGL